jgi:elongin-A
VDEDAQILKAAMDGIKNERAKHTSKVVDPRLVRLPKLPRMGGMRVEGGRAKAITAASGNPSLLTFTSGSKTKTLTGKGVLDKARREARELNLFTAKKSVLATPTHKLNDKATQIRSAPQGLVEEHRRPAVPLAKDSIPKNTTIIAPRRCNAAEKSSSSSSGGMNLEERERRLKALTNPSSPKKSLPVEGSEAPDSSVVSTTPRNPNLLHPASAYVVSKSRTLTPEPKGCRPAEKAKPAVDPFMPAKRRRIS